MAILIIDKDPRTRSAIRSMLKSTHGGVMIETKDFIEGARVLEQNKSKIQYVIASLLKENQSESSVFAKIKNAEACDAIPTIGLVSHSLWFKPKTYSEIKFRVDSYLKRPFAENSLHQALKTASINRLKFRQLIGYLGDPLSPNCQQFQKLLHSERFFFKDIHVFSSLAELQSHPTTLFRKMSAVVIDPVYYQSLKESSHHSLKKWVGASKTSIVCLGKDPKKVGPLRDQSDLFLPFEAFETDAQVKIIEDFLVSHWELDHSLQLMKHCSDRDESELQLSKRLIEKAPFYIHGYLQYADYLESREKLEQASKEYEKALGVNPFSPRAYLKLIKIMQKQGSAENTINALVKTAHEHCPGHPEILNLFHESQAK